LGENSVTLDSWAVLAWLQREPAGRLVQGLVTWAAGESDGSEVKPVLSLGPERPTLLLNVVNLGEVFYVVGRRLGLGNARDTIRDLRAMPIRVFPAEESLVMEAAAIKVHHRVSFADAFAAATAKINDSILLTGDPELRALTEITVHWMGSHQ